jgi:hypothetical protein
LAVLAVEHPQYSGLGRGLGFGFTHGSMGLGGNLIGSFTGSRTIETGGEIGATTGGKKAFAEEAPAAMAITASRCRRVMGTSPGPRCQQVRTAKLASTGEGSPLEPTARSAGNTMFKLGKP